MDGTLIATTRNTDLQSLGTGGQRAVHIWDQITGYVRRRLGPAHAALFAEPNPDPDRGTTDWYAEAAGTALPLDQLGEPHGTEARAAFERLHADLAAESERLRKSTRDDERFLGEMLGLALVTPSTAHVHVVGTQPVLVAWGHTVTGETRRPELLIAERARAAAPVRPSGSTSAGPMGTGPMASGPISPGPMTIVGPPAAERWRISPWLIGSALLSLAILALVPFLLLKDPFGWLVLPPAQCVVPPGELALQEELRVEERREGRMRAEIARMALALGDRRVQCPPVQAPRPVEQPALAPEAQRRADVQRAEQEGAKTGRIQIILAWDDTSDLDLAVFCPGGGQIYFSSSRACGGALDVDRNSHTPIQNPVENIVFNRDPPPGRYQIYVSNYKLGPGAPQPTAFRVTVRQEGKPDRTVTGTLAVKQQSNVTYFDVGPAR